MLNSPEPQNISPELTPRVWACGSGKGGVGKSVVTVNLGVSLAKTGKRCVLLDADLGAANLHTFFGLAQPRKTLADLFTRQAEHLCELLVPTGIPGLQLISGAQALSDMANPMHAQKQKILRQLATLEADCVLIDLGAGSSFNVLDFFLAADTRLLVVTPLPTSVENAYHFLKAGFYRQLKRVVREEGLERQTEELLQERQALGIRSPGELLAHLGRHFPLRGAKIVRLMRDFAPRILVNQARSDADRDLGRQMALAAGDYFGVPVKALGSIQLDDRVHSAIQRRMPVLDLFPQAGFSEAIRELTRNLLDGEENPDERHVPAAGL